VKRLASGRVLRTVSVHYRQTTSCPLMDKLLSGEKRSSTLVFFIYFQCICPLCWFFTLIYTLWQHHSYSKQFFLFLTGDVKNKQTKYSLGDPMQDMLNWTPTAIVIRNFFDISYIVDLERTKLIQKFYDIKLWYVLISDEATKDCFHNFEHQQPIFYKYDR
jgi:hypothetical protein